MSLYLAADDIGSARRRLSVAKALSAFGHRVQESVFELWLDPDDIPRLRLALGALLLPQDAVDIWPIDERGSRRRLSWQRAPENWSTVVIL